MKSPGANPPDMSSKVFHPIEKKLPLAHLSVRCWRMRSWACRKSTNEKADPAHSRARDRAEMTASAFSGSDLRWTCASAAAACSAFLT